MTARSLKITFLTILVVAIGAGALYWFLIRQDRNYAESILPESTAIYVYWPGIDRVKEQASETLLWKKISASSRKEVYRNQLQRLARLVESGTGVDPVPLLKQFTRDVSLAVVPITYSAQSAMLIAYVDQTEETREFLELSVDPNLKRRIPDLKKAPLTYRDQQYFKYTSGKFKQGTSPCYTFVDHHLLVTSSEVGMKTLLDVRSGKSAALKENDVFDESKDEVHHNDDVLLFLNGRSLLEVVKNRLPARAQSFWPAFLKVSGVEAVQGFTYRLGVEGEGFREEGYVTVADKREGFTKSYMQQRPQSLSGLSFLPADTEAAGAGTLPDGSAMWKEIQAQVQSILSTGEFSQLQAMIELMSRFLNFDFGREVIEPVGRQFSFASAGDLNHPGPERSRYFLALELKQPEQFRSMIEKLILLGQQRGLGRHAELYQGKTLQVLDVRAGGMQAAPALWIEGSWFYFGTDEDFVKQSIDAVKNKKTLLQNSDFKKVTSGFPNEVNSISYTNTRATLRRYAAVLQRESSARNREWIREYGFVEEMNELSESLFGSGSFSTIEKDGIRYRSYSSVPTSFFLIPTIVSAAMR